MKLPWGRHRLGGRSMFVDEDLQPIGPGFAAQLEHLERAPLSPAAAVHRLAEKVEDPGTDTNITTNASIGNVPPNSVGCDGELLRRLTLLQSDAKTRDLFRGEPCARCRYESRSEAELALALRLLHRDIPPELVNAVLFAAAIGKWSEEKEHYRRVTLHKAVERVRQWRRRFGWNGRGRLQ